MGKQLGWQSSKISRIEHAKQNVTDADIAAWCRECHVSSDDEQDLRDELRSIRAEEARYEGRLRTGNKAMQEEFARNEHSSTHIKVFETAYVPGLAQTADYARGVFARLAELHQTPADTDDAVAARMRRQDVLYDSDKHIDMLVTEGALRYPLCEPKVMIAQLDRLIALATLTGPRLGIIPLNTVMPAPVMHGFWIFDDAVTVEVANKELATREPEDLALYNRLFDALHSVAVEGEDARALLLRIAREYAETSAS